jgi:phage terminase small subunit
MPRQSIKEELEDNPFINAIGGLGKGLTAKQKRFAEEIAKGETGSEAYRKAYKAKGTPKTIANNAYTLKNRGDIQATIEAIERANEVMKYQTAEGLRSLAVSTLVDVLTNPETSPGVRIQTARIIGTMTEVSLFTHRTESKVIHSSEDIKAKILKEINSLMNGSAEDVVARDATSLLTELTQPQSTEHIESANDQEQETGENSPDVETHPHPTPPNQSAESHLTQHTIPHERSENSREQDDPLGLKNTTLKKNI